MFFGQNEHHCVMSVATAWMNLYIFIPNNIHHKYYFRDLLGESKTFTTLKITIWGTHILVIQSYKHTLLNIPSVSRNPSYIYFSNETFQFREFWQGHDHYGMKSWKDDVEALYSVFQLGSVRQNGKTAYKRGLIEISRNVVFENYQSKYVCTSLPTLCYLQKTVMEPHPSICFHKGLQPRKRILQSLHSGHSCIDNFRNLICPDILENRYSYFIIHHSLFDWQEFHFPFIPK